ncbi:GNAT family N-acetyltransferase [Synechococcus sp. UW140]|uniref:GNAT family N-acetyltransferase n=1 Tax=Synechococcus sp. UW140 TaxID=368503 RepID=UPI0025EB8D8E|nr:GNAT family N-acetyltransferase [Synechococcus sp. UW140]
MLLHLVTHSRFCLRLPVRDLQRLLQEHTFWGRERSLTDLRLMLRGSAAVVSLWKKNELVGFGRASSDGVYRAVLWDVVVKDELQGHGNGRLIVEALLNHDAIKNTERIYLMTTNQQGFYEQIGFEQQTNQKLMIINRKLQTKWN